MIYLFEALNKHLERQNIVGELYLVGGAVMCLVFDARKSTHDIDAFFKPTKIIRDISLKIAKNEGLDHKWLNDAVKGYLGERSSFDEYIEYPNLKIFTAQPEYMLAMKCLAMRIGEEFQDESDIVYLLRYLNIDKYEEAIEVISTYYDKEMFPQKTFYALEEILGR